MNHQIEKIKSVEPTGVQYKQSSLYCHTHICLLTELWIGRIRVEQFCLHCRNEELKQN